MRHSKPVSADTWAKGIPNTLYYNFKAGREIYEKWKREGNLDSIDLTEVYGELTKSEERDNERKQWKYQQQPWIQRSIGFTARWRWQSMMSTVGTRSTMIMVLCFTTRSPVLTDIPLHTVTDQKMISTLWLKRSAEISNFFGNPLTESISNRHCVINCALPDRFCNIVNMPAAVASAKMVGEYRVTRVK